MAGRGVDILLGGNPEGLAREEMLAERLVDPRTSPRSTRSSSPQFKDECAEEGDQVRELGGLYVLGTERHESRRIDNQLRGRSGRQGDPGESRFYLSLEDELMRLFATGAMNWVMGKAFPDDLPLEAKMVTKAIERAQRTVEDRNFEIRKDVLKYDEVMNEQRKVIYRRRQQILDGGDLRDEALDAIEAAIDRVVRRPVLRRRVPRGLGPRRALLADRATYFPTRITTRAARRAAAPRRRSSSCCIDDALEQYEAKEAVDRRREAPRDRAPRDALGDRPALARAPLRDGLPPRGHQPPGDGPAGPARGVAARGLRHVRGDDGPDRGRLRRATCSTSQVVVDDEPQAPVQQRAVQRAEDPVQGSSAHRARPRPSMPADGARAATTTTASRGDRRPSRVVQEPVRVEKTPGRNEPCFCGSGKKYKLCHGR